MTWKTGDEFECRVTCRKQHPAVDEKHCQITFPPFLNKGKLQMQTLFESNTFEMRQCGNRNLSRHLLINFIYTWCACDDTMSDNLWRLWWEEKKNTRVWRLPVAGGPATDRLQIGASVSPSVYSPPLHRNPFQSGNMGNINVAPSDYAGGWVLRATFQSSRGVGPGSWEIFWLLCSEEQAPHSLS